MEDRKTFEAIIGFLILLVCGLFLSRVVSVNKQQKYNKYGHILYAKFNNIDGIKVGSEVKIAGVHIGTVEETTLQTDTYQVKVKMNIRNDIQIPSDSIVAVTSSGLLGGKFLNVKIGVEDDFLQNGAYFGNSVSTLNLEDLINKVVAYFTSK